MPRKTRISNSREISLPHARTRILAGIALACIPLAFAIHAPEVTAEQTTWWVGADSHVGHPTEDHVGQHLAESVADVNALGIADYAIILGDLVEDRHEYAEVFEETMNALDVEWTYVLGNHDFDEDDHEPVLEPHYAAQTVQGIRFIQLSDELTGFEDRDLVMSGEQESWFWDELETHQDTPIFLFTHQPHWEVEIWPELQERLEDYNIAAWFSAHKHNWNIEEDTEYGFVQINIHSIGGVREDYLSTFLHLETAEDSVEAAVRFRDHQAQEWIAVDGQREVRFSVAR